VTWELHLNGCQSLKDKRRILKSLKDRLHQRFNISVAETGHQDLWQRAELSCAAVATDRRQAMSVLSQADQMVAGNGLVRIIDSATSVL
jgi:uncharacterized protein YlxP (DUF503 family)